MNKKGMRDVVTAPLHRQWKMTKESQWNEGTHTREAESPGAVKLRIHDNNKQISSGPHKSPINKRREEVAFDVVRN